MIPLNRDPYVLEFDVSSAGRRANSFSVASGCVRLTLEDDSEETINVPNKVARLLMTKDTAVERRSDALALIEACCEEAAQRRLVELQATRDHSSRDLKDRLIRDGYGAELAGRVVDGAAIGKVVSDRRFAEAFVHQKMQAGWGLSRIEHELRRHGVDASLTLAGWPEDYADPDDEYERALEAASRKHVREPNAYAKLVRFLCGRGFAQSVSMRAAKETLAEA